MTKWIQACPSISGKLLLGRFVCSLLLAYALAPTRAQAQDSLFFNHTPGQGWEVGNSLFQAHFRLNPDSTFTWTDFADGSGKVIWKASATPSSPINLRIDNTYINATTPLRLISQRMTDLRNDGRGLIITFHDIADQYEIEVHLRLTPGQPVLRHQVRVTNLRGTKVFVRANDILPYSFAREEGDYKAFRVNQWSVLNGGRNFETVSTTLSQAAQRMTMITGAGGNQCSWLAVQNQDLNGFFAGWEFDGRADVSFERKADSLDLSTRIYSLYQQVDPQTTYEAPSAFIGLFKGDWDEAGFRTQRFAEAALAPIVKDPRFPYIAWDSWGYEDQITEDILKREVDNAAALGVELFIVDLGWAKQMGEWTEDPKKFPSGLRSFSDYVHSKGMKFGLHFVISEAMASSPVLKQHPEWACSTNYNYHGAQSLALGDKNVQDWVIAEAIRLIDDYKVDWILQDGQTMVKQCTNRNLTFDYRNWNYAGDYGLNRILKEVQSARPDTMWENCANGGNMMTFRMVRNYVTSITNDASGSLGSRQGLYGASFPFPPRYTDRYMPTSPITDYNTRSFIFGGPWILMNRLSELTWTDMNFLASEISTYKQIRGSIRDGKVDHVSARPAAGRTDAIASYNPATDQSIAVVVRDNTATGTYTLKLKDLNPAQTYKVTFQDSPRVYTMTGDQLMTKGVTVNLPDRESAEIVYARPLN